MRFPLPPSRLLGHLALAAALLAPCAAMAEPDMIYLVRHGEKAADGNDPSLTPQGRQRAQNIATMLHRAGIKAIFSSATARTLETAKPLSTSLSLPVQQYDAGSKRVRMGWTRHCLARTQGLPVLGYYFVRSVITTTTL